MKVSLSTSTTVAEVPRTGQTMFSGKSKYIQVPLEHYGPIRGARLKVHLHGGPITNGRIHLKKENWGVCAIVSWEVILSTMESAGLTLLF